MKLVFLSLKISVSCSQSSNRPHVVTEDRDDLQLCLIITKLVNPSRSTMPEIAEVERARTILEQILKDQTIIDVESVYPDLSLH